MKVYQIVVEDYDDYGLTGLGNSDSSKKDKSKTDNNDSKSDQDDDSAVSKAVSTVKEIGGEATKYADIFGIDLKTIAIGAGTLAAAGFGTAAAAKITGAALSKVSTNLARKFNLAGKIQDRVNRRFGPWSKLFGIVGIASGLVQLYSNLVILEAMYVQGKLPGEDGGFAVLNAQREFEFGVFSVQVATPAIVKIISYLLGTTQAIKWFIRLLGAASTTVTLGASIAGVLASEAFVRWLQWFLGTEPAREWLREHMMSAVQLVGWPTEAFVSKLMGYYNKADVKKYGSPEAAKQAQKDREDKKTKGPLGITAKTGFITLASGDQIPVTDKEGYLLPAGRFEGDGTIYIARKKAIDAGQEDPLAKFPVKPGEKFPRFK